VQTKNTPCRDLKFLVAILFTLVVAFHLTNALLGKPLFRAPHLGTALEYSHNSINLLKPVIVGFNANGTPTPLEFPIWQATAGALFKLTGSTWYGWGNVISLALFATGLWPFFHLARRYLDERTAWWGLAFFLAQPLIVIAAGQGSTDGLSLVLTIWFLFFAERMICTGRFVWWLPTVLFAALSVTLKPPFFMAVGLCSAFLLLLNRNRNWRTWAMLISVGLGAGIIFLLWTNYTYAILAQAEYPFAEMRVAQSPVALGWFFGDLHFRLNPAVWLKGGWRFLHATLGTLPMVALLIVALLRPGNRFSKLWLLATFLTALVFTSAVLIHWHYYLMCCPVVALLCGATLSRWENFWAQELPRAELRLWLAGIVLVFSAIDGVIATKISIFYDSSPREMAKIIRDHTQADDRLIIYCAGSRPWAGEELFGAGRNGLFVSNLENLPQMPTVKGLLDLLASESDLRRLKSLGYNKLVLISESTAQFAVQAVNPGSTRKRFYYPKTISPIVDAWPVVYQSEEILIKEIP
jgi:hypothetical protein